MLETKSQFIAGSKSRQRDRREEVRQTERETESTVTRRS